MKQKTQGWKRVACCEKPDLQPKAIKQSQLELPLSAMSEALAIQLLVSMSMSVTHTTKQEHGMSLFWETARTM